MVTDWRSSQTNERTATINLGYRLERAWGLRKRLKRRPQLDAVMGVVRQELVRRVAAADRETNRDIYDALEKE